MKSFLFYHSHKTYKVAYVLSLHLKICERLHLVVLHSIAISPLVPLPVRQEPAHITSGRRHCCSTVCWFLLTWTSRARLTGFAFVIPLAQSPERLTIVLEGLVLGQSVLFTFVNTSIRWMTPKSPHPSTVP